MQDDPINKPIVSYNMIEGCMFFYRYYPQEKRYALQASVAALNHPVYKHQTVTTSEVVKIDTASGLFETLNSIYVPKELDK